MSRRFIMGCSRQEKDRISYLRVNRKSHKTTWYMYNICTVVLNFPRIVGKSKLQRLCGQTVQEKNYYKNYWIRT